MLRLALALSASTLLPAIALAQQSATVNSHELGRRLFTQSCGVCHLKPQITAAQFGPVLSKDSLSGDLQALTTVISDGTPRMPGFKHHFSQAEIGAIAAYIKTLSPPAAAAGAKAKGAKSTGNDDD